MKRLAYAAVLVWLWAACSAANACSCMGMEVGLSRWVEAMASEADRIVLATVTVVSVNDSAQPVPNRSATVKVLRSLKGSDSISRIEEAPLCQNFRLKRNETRVFFTDKNGVILACSDYRPWLKNDGLILELERVLKKRAT